MARHRILNRLPDSENEEKQQLIDGLRGSPAVLSPKYFYDELGCALYGAICQLPEYYPTRTEASIFAESRDAIAGALGTGRQFVDLGAGDCAKGRAWIPFLKPSRYVAVDIAGPEIDRALADMAADFPTVEMVGLVTDFSQQLALDDALADGPVTFFYPGSSIGNFMPAQAVLFLQRLAKVCRSRPGSNLLIGVDAKKSAAVLDAAYDDALGVTAAFNRNVLLHLNRRFGFNFDLGGFVHRGFYNAKAGRIEMHLEAVRAQTVVLDGMERCFSAGERIHTENSYKYAAAEFSALLEEAGFTSIRRWTDAQDAFHVFAAG